jgi:hypothetical protein
MALEIAIHPSDSCLWQQGYEIEEEAEIYDMQLQDLLENPRWYLDNLDYLREYRVKWHNYSVMKGPVMPWKYVNSQRLIKNVPIK